MTTQEFANPVSSKLTVNAIVGQIATTSTSGSDISVANIRTLLVDSGAGNIVIPGFTGSSSNFLLNVIKSNINNTVVLVHNDAGSAAKIWCPGGVNLTLSNLEGVTLYFSGTVWLVGYNS